MTTLALNKSSHPFLRRFVPLFGAGLLGIVALNLAVLPDLMARFAQLPGLETITAPTAFLLATVQPAILLAILVAIGTLLTPRLGLSSHLAGDATPLTIRAEAPMALTVGAVGGALLVLLDLLARPFVPAIVAGESALGAAVSHTTLLSVVTTLFYGGVTEELLLRWGLMTLFVWTGWRLFQRGTGAPRPAIVWGANIVAALLFGALHLPAAAVLFGSLTPLLVARTLLLNGLFGLGMGWLFWRRSLESAMLAHMMSHVILTIVNLALAG